MKSTQSISVIVPAFRTGKQIEKNIDDLYKILSENFYDFEIICVVDGLIAGDRTNAHALIAQKHHAKEVKVITYSDNKGKGYAVRQGLSKAKGNIIGFIDAGNDIDYSGILILVRELQESGTDIVIGSKRHKDSVVNYPLKRRLFSYGYQTLIKILFGLSVSDTQVGLKIFKKEAVLKVLPYLTINGFAFDIELLVIAQKLGFTIIEAPVSVTMGKDEETTVRYKGGFILVSLKVLSDTLKVYQRIRSHKRLSSIE